ncbi:MAG TPA: oligosaccharide flippase family protein [Azospirillum sp.]|nr:oligosaccharide flippase family protein [Azospirillum sp.]
MLGASLIYFAGRFGAALIALVAVSVYTRLLSPAEYGILAVTLTTVTVLHACLTNWLRISVIRFLPERPENEDTVLSSIFLAMAVTAGLILVAGALVLLVAGTGAVGGDLVGLAAAYFFVYSLVEVGNGVHSARLRPRLYVLNVLIRNAVMAALGGCLAWFGFGAAGVVAGAVVGNLIPALLILVPMRRHLRRQAVDRGLVRQLAHYGIPFAVSGAFASVLHAADRYIILGVLGSADAGLYSAPYDLAQRTLHMTMMMVNLAGAPLLIRAYAGGGWEAAQPVLVRVGQLLMIVALPATTLFMVLSPLVASVFFGPEFRPAATVLLPWIAFGTLLHGLQSFYVAFAFSLTKRPLRQTGVLAGAAAVNIALVAAVTPWFGLVGAAVATVASYAVLLAGSLMVGRRLLPVPVPLADLSRVGAACAVLALCLWPVRDGTAPLALAAHLAAGVLGFAAVLWLTDAAGARDAVRRIVRGGTPRRAPLNP